MNRDELKERFMRRVKEDPETGCWIWQGSVDAYGYGQYRTTSKNWKAHRLSFFLAGNELIDGMTIDHLCRNRHCVNPAHLEQVTIRENVLRGAGLAVIHANTQFCPKGHPYDASNTRISMGIRYCKTCGHAQNKRWRDRQKTERQQTS